MAGTLTVARLRAQEATLQLMKAMTVSTGPVGAVGSVGHGEGCSRQLQGKPTGQMAAVRGIRQGPIAEALCDAPMLNVSEADVQKPPTLSSHLAVINDCRDSFMQTPWSATPSR
jgi:hypothetical protein